MIMAALLFYVYVDVSCRQAVKSLKLINHLFNNQLGKVPSYRSVNCWVAKAGLASLKGSVKSLKEAYALIVDASISVGDQQLLLFLKIPAEHKGHALTHEDAEVAGMKVAASWPAEKVKEMAQGIIDSEERNPEYILSDNGANLRKATELLDIQHHRDVSHTLATYLKQVYENDEEYKLFSDQIAKTKHLALTDVAYLMPCKQRRMARFMNLYPIVDWASRILENFHNLTEKERFHYSFIQSSASLISELGEVLSMFEKVMEILKKEGLTFATAARCKLIVQKAMLPAGRTAKLRELICSYLYQEAKLLADASEKHNISSDIMESRFGLLKNKMPMCKAMGFTSSSLVLPLYSKMQGLGKVNQAQIVIWMSNTRVNDVKDWTDNNLKRNPMIKRREKLTQLA